MADVEFVSDVPRYRLRKWQHVAQQLRTQPGVWALVGTFDFENAAHAPRQCLKREGCEVKVRKTYGADEWRVYARVGPSE